MAQKHQTLMPRTSRPVPKLTFMLQQQSGPSSGEKQELFQSGLRAIHGTETVNSDLHNSQVKIES